MQLKRKPQRTVVVANQSVLLLLSRPVCNDSVRRRLRNVRDSALLSVGPQLRLLLRLVEEMFGDALELLLHLHLLALLHRYQPIRPHQRPNTDLVPSRAQQGEDGELGRLPKRRVTELVVRSLGPSPLPFVRLLRKRPLLKTMASKRWHRGAYGSRDAADHDFRVLLYYL